ncbi:large ribosomal subunit protein mL53-like [Ptychodera flava]|uniref:large ribosomal subunit protein mL53-like n=1 Tax=Ptychodera flava TaxID=63121 RepID=UPI00396A6A09
MAYVRPPIVRGLTLKGVQSIKVQFCPFQERVRATRQFLCYIGNENMRRTNPKCRLETKVLNDNSEPTVDMTFDDGSRLLFKCRNLTRTEILKRFAAEIKEKYPDAYEEACL